MIWLGAAIVMLCPLIPVFIPMVTPPLDIEETFERPLGI